MRRFELPIVSEGPVVDVSPTTEKPAKAPKKTRRIRKPKPAPASVPTPTPEPVVQPQPVAVKPEHNVKRWAAFGVMFTLVLSAMLNGYSNSLHAPLAVAGWLMGIAIPVLVLVLSKVCGEKFRVGQRPVAWFSGASGIALLILSVWHCSQSIALLTGSPVALALPLAVAIDCGLVACEVSLITEPRV